MKYFFFICLILALALIETPAISAASSSSSQAENKVKIPLLDLKSTKKHVINTSLLEQLIRFKDLATEAGYTSVFNLIADLKINSEHDRLVIKGLRKFFLSESSSTRTSSSKLCSSISPIAPVLCSTSATRKDSNPKKLMRNFSDKMQKQNVTPKAGTPTKSPRASSPKVCHDLNMSSGGGQSISLMSHLANLRCMFSAHQNLQNILKPSEDLDLKRFYKIGFYHPRLFFENLDDHSEKNRKRFYGIINDPKSSEEFIDKLSKMVRDPKRDQSVFQHIIRFAIEHDKSKHSPETAFRENKFLSFFASVSSRRFLSEGLDHIVSGILHNPPSEMTNLIFAFDQKLKSEKDANDKNLKDWYQSWLLLKEYLDSSDVFANSQVEFLTKDQGIRQIDKSTVYMASIFVNRFLSPVFTKVEAGIWAGMMDAKALQKMTRIDTKDGQEHLVSALTSSDFDSADSSSYVSYAESINPHLSAIQAALLNLSFFHPE